MSLFKKNVNVSQPGIASSVLSHVVENMENHTVNKNFPYKSVVRDLKPYHWITIIAVPAIVLLGLTGNILSIWVLLRKRFRSTSTSVYLVALAMADSVYLVNNFMLVNWIRIFFGVDIRLFSVYSCQLYVYVIYVCKCLGAWLVVAVTFERLVAVKWPHRARELCTKRRAYHAISGLTLTTCIVYSYIPPLHTIWYEGPIGPDCSFKLPKNVELRVLHFLDMFVYSLIPSSLLLGTNTALIRSVAAQTRKFTKSNSRGKRLIKSDTRRLTAMLLTVSLTYLVLTFPMTAVVIYQVFFRIPKHWMEIYTTAYSVSLLNNAINFALYCVSGPAFRQQLSVVFHCSKGSQGFIAQRPYSVRFLHTSQVYQSQANRFSAIEAPKVIKTIST